MDDFTTLDDLLPERATLGSHKPAGVMTPYDVKLILQALYQRDVLGQSHVSKPQFMEGTKSLIFEM